MLKRGEIAEVAEVVERCVSPTGLAKTARYVTMRAYPHMSPSLPLTSISSFQDPR